MKEERCRGIHLQHITKRGVAITFLPKKRCHATREKRWSRLLVGFTGRSYNENHNHQFYEDLRVPLLASLILMKIQLVIAEEEIGEEANQHEQLSGEDLSLQNETQVWEYSDRFAFESQTNALVLAAVTNWNS
ncbi:hypothetical protein SUGI_1196110 [Cryptomeria japonica]|nr:hypothetical protein SUGI_1196110 [Cryptomeria japonica]